MIDAAKIEELRGLFDASKDVRLGSDATGADYEAAQRRWGATCRAIRDHGSALLDLAASLASAGEDGELCKALTSYQQADEEGVMVLVSRQACDEAAARLRALASEKEGLRRERDNARAESAWLAKRLIKLREALNNITDGIDDEGDRAYFGSTNDADWLKAIAQDVDAYAFDRITRESKWPDYIETSQLAHERESALRAENERLRKALIDATAHLAAATSSYERFCRRGVTGDALYTTKLDDYQKATARARSELEAGHE